MRNIMIAALLGLTGTAHALGIVPAAGGASGLGPTIPCVAAYINIDGSTIYIDCSNNRVGIGTTSPATPLDVNGAFQWGSGATKSTGSATGNLTLDTNATLQAGTTFYVGGGRVGIGTTSPGYLLDVNGQIHSGATGYRWDVANGVGVIQSGSTSGDTSINVFNAAGNGDGSLNIGGFNTASYAYLKSNGNVGIGTTSPATVLDANGSAQFGSGATKSTFTATGFLTMGGAVNLQAKTIAELQAISPAVGDSYRCTNCAVPNSVAIATGTGAGNFGIVAPGAFQ